VVYFERKKVSHLFSHRALLLCVFVSFVTGQSVCGVGTAATRTTCDLTDALTACRTCFPNADPGCTLAIDPVTSITTLTTFRFQDYTAGGAVPAVFSYPVGVVLVFRNDVHFNTALSFCVPSVRTYLPSNTFLISVPGNYVSRMDGGIILRVGSVVPNALNLMTASNTATNFYGVFSYVNPTNQDGVVTPCFSVRATPTYNIGSPNTVTVRKKDRRICVFC
jgi:hypothetical protein